MRIVIVGNGPAAISAVEAVHESNAASEIVMLSAEERGYTPCFLGRYVAGKASADELAIAEDGFYAEHGVELRCGAAVERVDTGRAVVVLADGSEVAYDKLLLACGASPVVPDVPGLTGEGVVTFRSLADAERIKQLACGGRNAVVLGSGFVAVEAAEALVEAGFGVTLIARRDRILRRIFDAEIAAMIEWHLEANGVRVAKERDLVQVERTDDGRIATAVLSDGERLPCGLLVVAVGMRPNLQPLEGSGIATAAGVLTDASMRTSAPDVFAAGDVAEPDIGGLRKSNLIHPNAVATGRAAGRAMAGAEQPMEAHLEDMNVLTVFGRSFLSVGTLEGSRVVSRRLGPQDFVKVFAGADEVVTGVELAGDVTRGGLYASLIRRRISLDDVPGLLSPGFGYAETLRLP